MQTNFETMKQKGTSSKGSGCAQSACAGKHISHMMAEVVRVTFAPEPTDGCMSHGVRRQTAKHLDYLDVHTSTIQVLCDISSIAAVRYNPVTQVTGAMHDELQAVVQSKQLSYVVSEPINADQ